MDNDLSHVPGNQIPGVPSDNVSQVSILRELADEDYTGHLHPEADGTLRCGACDARLAPEELTDVRSRRMEGASDPDDMTLVVAARCPHCGAGGVVVLGYGPNASEADAAVLVRLPDV